MNLTDFWPTIPTLTIEQLKTSAVVFPTLEAAQYLTGQDGINQAGFYTRTAVLQVQDGRWVMRAELLREFHPSTRTGIYHPDYAAIITAIGNVTLIEPWATTATKLPPSRPQFSSPPPWVQPVPGLVSQWFNMGYPFNFLVRHTIDGTEYTMRSLLNFNVFTPAFDARLWEPVPPQAVLWKAGQVWDIGAVVRFPVNDPAFPPPVTHWRSKINANTSPPSHDAGFYRFWGIADADFDPNAPRPFVSGRAYGIGERIIAADSKIMESVHPNNVWTPTQFPTGWKQVVAKSAQQEIAAKRARSGGQFVADDPSTPENEAWIDGEAP
jgi:hypothetical protein